MKQFFRKKLFLTFIVACLCSTAAIAAPVTLRVENDTERDIHELYFVLTHRVAKVDKAKGHKGEIDWGRDHLGNAVLERDTETTVKLEPGTYDVRAVDEHGNTYTLLNRKITRRTHELEIDEDDID